MFNSYVGWGGRGLYFHPVFIKIMKHLSLNTTNELNKNYTILKAFASRIKTLPNYSYYAYSYLNRQVLGILCIIVIAMRSLFLNMKTK